MIDLPPLIALVVLLVLCGAVGLAAMIRHRVPEQHRNAETKDSIKTAMGLIATMAALLLGLLVASAKGAYDTSGGEVTRMAGKFAFLGRLLADYGDGAAPVRAQLKTVLEDTKQGLWYREKLTPAINEEHFRTGNRLYSAIQQLPANTDVEKNLRTQAASEAIQLGEIRSLLVVQAVPSVAPPLLIVVVAWLFIIFFAFTFLAPPNATAHTALVLSAVAVAGAIFLVLELEQPFSGLLHLSPEPMDIAARQIEK